MKNIWLSLVASVGIVAFAGASLVGCNGKNNTIQPPDGGSGPPPCFNNPTGYLEIINACTNAQKVDKHPVLPLLLPDGGLPPLP